MRRLVLIIPIIAILGLCGCQTTHSSLKEHITFRDSVNIRDSVRIKDSLVISRSIKDSLRLRDSVVLHLDSSGNVTKREEFHERDHYHGESDSVKIYMAKLHEALAEREQLLKEAKQDKEIIVKEPSPLEKLKLIFYGMLLSAILAWLLNVSKKFQNKS